MAPQEGDEAPPIRIKRSDRVLFTGATGSGKSTIARFLVEYLPYFVIVDPKHEWKEGPLTAIITSKAETLLDWPDTFQVIYRPSIADQEAGLPDFWNVVWHIGNVGVLLDELVTITPPTQAPLGMRRAYQMGRSRGIGVWGITQRPARVPMIVLSEANHYFSGRLALKADRERMAEVMQTPAPVVEPIEDDYLFWYAGAGGKGVRQITASEIRRT